MTDLRTAARQALETLEQLVIGTEYEEAVATEKIITALKAALEQPEPPPEAQTEAEKIAYCAGWWAAMEQKREQPEQEPVVCPHRDEPRGCYRVRCQLGRKCVEPLYTHPPRREWRGLTEEEIQSIHDTYHKRMGPQEFARSVEAALKERNV